MSSLALLVALCAVGVIALAALSGCAWLGRRLAAARRDEARLRRQAEEATRTGRETNRFVAGVTHELRTPLTAIIGFTELLRDGRAGTVNRHQHEYLGVVRSSAGNLLKLIDEELDCAGVQAGHIHLDPEPVVPAMVAQECAVPLRHLASERGIALEYRALDPGAALLDPGRLRQVIVNLLSNAIKFTDAGGGVTLTVGRRGDRLLVSVSDTGIGIAEADRGRIFEPFVRIGGRERAGSGLGLALTRELVQAQGGSIGVESRPGAGSTFTVWLPWVAADRATSPSGGEWERAVGRPRRFRPGGARRGPGAADAASRPASARAGRP